MLVLDLVRLTLYGLIDDLFDLVDHYPAGEFGGPVDKGDRIGITHLQHLVHGRVIAQAFFIHIHIFDFHFVPECLLEVVG